MQERSDRYSNVSVFLHWIIALLIVVNICLGLMMGAHIRGVFPYHESVGLTVLLLSVIRLLWRLANPWPPLPAQMAGWEKALSRIVHVLFYVAIIAIPLMGWLAVSASPGDHGIPKFWGVVIPRLPITQDHELHEQLGDIHAWMVWATVGLLVLHIAGAWKHTYMQKDHELARMIPGLKTPGA
jgi:cytochrome b561